MTPYYDADGITLYHGDCREVLPLLATADVVMTDPPYSKHVHSNIRSSGMGSPRDKGERSGASVRRNIDLGFEHLSEDLRAFCSNEFARLAARWILVFSDIESGHLWRADLTAAGLDYVRTGAWVKLNATPMFSGDRPASGFEAVTICHPKGRKRWNGGGRHALWTYPIVLDRGEHPIRLHTTQKPLALMRELVGLFTEPGEVILDPFAGSGTTLVAARLAGRKAVGVEQDEGYCEKVVRRLEVGDLAAADPTSTQADLFGGAA